jgi:hypothetical protein
MPLLDLTTAPNASSVLCTPYAKVGTASLTYDLTSQAILDVAFANASQADLQPLGSLVDAGNASNVVNFNGSMFNGFFLNDFWTGEDSYSCEP